MATLGERWNKWKTDAYEKIFKTFGIDDPDLYPAWMPKFIRWWAYKAIPFVLMISAYWVIYAVGSYFAMNYGLDKVLIFSTMFIYWKIHTIQKMIESHIEKGNNLNKKKTTFPGGKA